MDHSILSLEREHATSAKRCNVKDTLEAARRCVAAAALVLAGCGGGGEGQNATPPPAPESFAYVTNASSNSVSLHDANGGTGSLSAVQTAAPAGIAPVSVAVDPSGKFLYVANFLSFDISEYTIDPGNGTLTLIRAPISTGAGKSPLFVGVHPSGRFAYVATLLNNPTSGEVTPYSIDATTGALTALSDGVFAGREPSSIAIAPSGRFAYVADFGTDVVWTFAIDPATGALTNANPNQPAVTVPM